jgi:hypothetical protein
MMKNFLIAAAMAAAPIVALPNDNLNVRAACARDNCFRGVRQDFITHNGVSSTR